MKNVPGNETKNLQPDLTHGALGTFTSTDSTDGDQTGFKRGWGL